MSGETRGTMVIKEDHHENVTEVAQEADLEVEIDHETDHEIDQETDQETDREICQETDHGREGKFSYYNLHYSYP